MQKDRLIWIDITKGVCILGIVFFHFFQNYHDRWKFSEYLGIQGAKIGFAAVDIFFVIAGFNISYTLATNEKNKQIQLSDINWFNWLKRKFVRLYPSYWLALLSTLVIYLVFDRTIKLELGFKTILLLLGLTSYQDFKDINPGFWFFSVIVQAFLIAPLILLATKSQPKNILLTGILIGSIDKILFWITSLVANKSFWYYFLLQNSFIGSYFFQFCLGLYWGFVYYRNQKFRRQDFRYSLIFLGLGVLVYVVGYIFNVDVLYKSGFDICFTPISLLVFYYWFDRDPPKQKGIHSKLLSVISVLGFNSYQIYLLHQPVFFVGFPLLIKNISLPSYLKLLSIAIVIFACLFCYVKFFLKLELLIKDCILKYKF
jgi:peptidoglycan/LPS O-acetylase OafA/YrhL